MGLVMMRGEERESRRDTALTCRSNHKRLLPILAESRTTMYIYKELGNRSLDTLDSCTDAAKYQPTWRSDSCGVLRDSGYRDHTVSTQSMARLHASNVDDTFQEPFTTINHQCGKLYKRTGLELDCVIVSSRYGPIFGSNWQPGPVTNQQLQIENVPSLPTKVYHV
jgi:hypothetical protein